MPNPLRRSPPLGRTRAGDRDRPIRIQTGARIASGEGYPDVDWTDAAEVIVFAMWMPASSLEQNTTSPETLVDGVFRIPDVVRPSTDRSRIVDDLGASSTGRTYDVKAYIEVGDGLIDVPVIATGEV